MVTKYYMSNKNFLPVSKNLCFSHFLVKVFREKKSGHFFVHFSNM